MPVTKKPINTNLMALVMSFLIISVFSSIIKFGGPKIFNNINFLPSKHELYNHFTLWKTVLLSLMSD